MRETFEYITLFQKNVSEQTEFHILIIINNLLLVLGLIFARTVTVVIAISVTISMISVASISIDSPVE